MNPWDFINDIRFAKKNIMREAEYDKAVVKEYNPFITNKALSFYPDCILFANEMNTRHWLDKRMQYDFYINIVRPNKKFQKWLKKDANDNLDIIKEYYQCSDRKAVEFERILTSEQIDHIKKLLYKGGQKK